MNLSNTLSAKEKKRLYDIEYRRKNLELIKAKKRAYYQSESGKACTVRNRAQQKENHLEYCRQDWYKLYKKDYDRVYRAKKFYGEFWEVMILCEEIQREVCKLVPIRYERMKMRDQVSKMIARNKILRSAGKRSIC